MAVLASNSSKYLTPLGKPIVFQKIHYRLLGSYLGVFTSILVLFAIAVRSVFSYNLDKLYEQKLINLARSASSDMFLQEGKLQVRSDFDWKELNSNHQALQWFDIKGNVIETIGLNVLNVPFSTKQAVQLPFSPAQRAPIEQDERRIDGVTWPVINISSGRTIGYVRASQSPADFDKTLRQLDLGLGSGIFLSLVFSSIGGVFLSRQAMQPVEESFQRLKQFTADASHELRGPLMAIKSNVAVALKYPQGMRETDAEKLKAIASATNQMAQLTEDLLLLARTEQAPSKEHKPVDLEMLLESVVRLYAPQAQEKGISLKVNLSSHLYLLGDPVHLNRLFSNLIENALRYTQKEGTIEIQSSREGQSILVNVRDTGIGIAPEHLKFVFERFWQVDKTRPPQAKGSGLGLAIAQAIAHNHGGSINVTSQLEIGSCFTVRLRAWQARNLAKNTGSPD
jgi:signal transduction histidine kinase